MDHIQGRPWFGQYSGICGESAKLKDDIHFVYKFWKLYHVKPH